MINVHSRAEGLLGSYKVNFIYLAHFTLNTLLFNVIIQPFITPETPQEQLII